MQTRSAHEIAVVKKSVTISLSGSLLKQIDERRAALGLSRSAFLESFLRVKLPEGTA
jgi:predicted DNA binding CopG/RHH family protein